VFVAGRASGAIFLPCSAPLWWWAANADSTSAAGLAAKVEAACARQPAPHHAALALGCSLVAPGVEHSRPTSYQPQRIHIRHTLAAKKRRAYWFSTLPRPDAWVQQMLTHPHRCRTLYQGQLALCYTKKRRGWRPAIVWLLASATCSCECALAAPMCAACA